MSMYKLYKTIRKVFNMVIHVVDTLLTRLILKGNNVSFDSFRTSDIPYVMVAEGQRSDHWRKFHCWSWKCCNKEYSC